MGHREETIEYVDAATGGVLDGQNGNSPPRRTRHVYIGLEMIQEYECGGPSPACEQGGFGGGPLLMREFFHGDPERYPEVVAMQTYAVTLTAGIPPVSVPAMAYHYLHDALGSVIGLVDEDGALVERYTYDPYGKVFIETWDETAEGGQGAFVPAETYCGLGATACGKMPYSPTGNPFGFTGHVYLPSVGLVFAPKRVYDPVLGRWLQRDPLEYEDGINLYEYVRSSPVNFTDPFGLLTFRDLVRKNACVRAIRRLMWDLSQKEGREVSGQVNITDKGRLTLIMRLGDKDVVNPTKWWLKTGKPRRTVGMIHTHPSPVHARGPSEGDKKFAKDHDLPNAVIHWVDDPKNPDNATKPTKYKTTFFGPKVNDELPREINPDEEIRIQWTDEVKNKNLNIPLPKECQKQEKKNCDNTDKTPKSGK